MDVTMPQLGETVTEGTITRWFKQVGESIAADEPLFEVSTDKVDSEVPAPAAGIVSEILVPEGDTVPVGARLAVISDSVGAAPPSAEPEPFVPLASEAPVTPAPEPVAPAPEPVAPAPEPTVAPPPVAAAPPPPAPAPPPPAPPISAPPPPVGTPSPPPPPAPAPQPAPAAASDPSTIGPSTVGSNGGGLVTSPLVRRMIAEQGLDPSQIHGTGEGGRITRNDVVEASRGHAAAPQPTPPPAAPDTTDTTGPAVAPTAPAAWSSPPVPRSARPEASMPEIAEPPARDEPVFARAPAEPPAPEGETVEPPSPAAEVPAEVVAFEPPAPTPTPAPPAAGPPPAPEPPAPAPEPPAPAPEPLVQAPAPAPPPAPAPVAAAAPAPARPAAPAAADEAAVGPDEIVPFDNIRRRTAEHMVRSKATSAHVYTSVRVDFERIERTRRAHQAAWKHEEGFSLTYLPFIVRALCDVVHDYPHVNASVDGESLVVHHNLHLGVAVDLDFKGLVAPVIRNADGKRLRLVAREIRDLAARAKSKQLGPDEVVGGTFTITNMGPFGTTMTLPIINQPQVAIMATDGIRKEPVVVTGVDGEDSIAIHHVGALVLAWDHRAFDGAYAASFLNEVRTVLETRDWDAELA